MKLCRLRLPKYVIRTLAQDYSSVQISQTLDSLDRIARLNLFVPHSKATKGSLACCNNVCVCLHAGYSDMADELLTRALTVNEATRKWLENVCQSLEVARRAEHVLEQWQKSLMKDIQAWMKAHDIPIASSNPVDDNRKNAFKNAYDGEFNALRSLIEENIDRLPPGVDALQFKVNRHGLPLWQERGLQKLITSKQLGIRINTDAQQWSVECDTTDGLVAKFLEPLPRKELLMQRYGCRFVFGIHVCTTCQYTKCIKALLACATIYRLLDISLNGLPRETIVDELYEDGLLVEHADVANLAITLSFSQMCSLRQKLGYACDYQLHEDQAGHWVANMDIGN
jgi:hypothetical protein